MNITGDKQHRALLQSLARKAMIDRGLAPDFPSDALAQLDTITRPAAADGSARDLRHLLWCSIDDDDSLDLDQLTTADGVVDSESIVYVAIADVDVLIGKQTPIDAHARHNTVSVYTAAQIFPMLPEKLSTGFTSLNFDSDRMAMVVEMRVNAQGEVLSSDVYRAVVRNKAKLAYRSVAAWLEGEGPMPKALAAVEGLADCLRLQDNIAQKMRRQRHQHGALDLDSIEVNPVFDGEELTDLLPDDKNRARALIEDLMIAANGVSARFLSNRQYPSFRRMVKKPERWDRIVEVAAEHGGHLGSEPDARALEEFLVSFRQRDPLRFPDLSLAIIKLLGPGEYAIALPEANVSGHFGLAVKDYSHSTAPNRRYPDLITQRLIKAALLHAPVPYSVEELEALALHCTKQEDAARKVERQVIKSAAAILLQSRIGQEFDAIVTGAANKGTWVRVLHPPVEGKLVGGFFGLKVGYKIRVKLLSTDIENGFIDFERV